MIGKVPLFTYYNETKLMALSKDVIGLVCCYCNIDELYMIKQVNKEYFQIASQYIFKLIHLCTIQLPKIGKSLSSSTDKNYEIIVNIKPSHLWNLYLMLKDIKIIALNNDDDNYDENGISSLFKTLFKLNSYSKII